MICCSRTYPQQVVDYCWLLSLVIKRYDGFPARFLSADCQTSSKKGSLETAPLRHRGAQGTGDKLWFIARLGPPSLEWLLESQPCRSL